MNHFPAALVTGGARRLGAAMSRALAELGHPVVIHYHKAERDALAFAQALQQQGRAAYAVQADLRDPAQAQRLIAHACEQAGPVGLLVNSASIYPRASDADLSPETCAALHALHVDAPRSLSGAVAAQAIPAVIVNLLDARFAEAESHPTRRVYLQSKAALALQTLELARALAPSVRVNGIAPGLVLAPDDAPAAFDSILGRIPLRRAGAPADVVDALRYLVRARYVTGQILYVDGGRHLQETGNFI